MKISPAWNRGVQKIVQWSIFALAPGKQVAPTLVCECWGNERQADTGYAVAMWLHLAILLGAINSFLVVHGVLSLILLGINIE